MIMIVRNIFNSLISVDGPSLLFSSFLDSAPSQSSLRIS